ncbi:MAG: GNAT family N-acetyltransferase [Candidatus Thorarchaeota archaeon]
MSTNQFIPDDFEIPALFETAQFRLRMLSVDDVEKDYDAVIESRKLLHAMFGGPWPREGFTIEENLIDLDRHHREFLERKAFAYTVVSLDESKVLGCIYIKPSPPELINTNATVYMWVRQSEYDKGLDETLFLTVKQWIRRVWPFKKVAYPGRE